MEMQPVQSTPTPSNIRPQDLIMQFLAVHTQLAVRLSQNLQQISRDLLERVRKTAATRIPLEGPFSNMTKQTIFQMVGAGASFYLKMQATQVDFRAHLLSGTLTPIQEMAKTNFKRQGNHLKNAANIVEQVAQGSMSYLKGSGDAQEFRQQELQQFQQQNASCLGAAKDAQDTLVSMTKQIITH
ncbi:MAG: hypothetical protein LVR00_01175 [Rhabdochlamydiaceae bacterium]|jgi:hypothetical protein